MAKEIEKKFLVVGEDWRLEVEYSQQMRQGYLANTPHASIRIRIAGTQAQLNIKSAAPTVCRDEYEYRIPLGDAETMLSEMCLGQAIVKTRHHIHYRGKLWEIDEFHEANTGLLVAEIELEEIDEAFKKPVWLGREVSHLARYYNPLLIQAPYSTWNPDLQLKD